MRRHTHVYVQQALAAAINCNPFHALLRLFCSHTTIIYGSPLGQHTSLAHKHTSLAHKHTSLAHKFKHSTQSTRASSHTPLARHARLLHVTHAACKSHVTHATCLSHKLDQHHVHPPLPPPAPTCALAAATARDGAMCRVTSIIGQQQLKKKGEGEGVGG